MSGSSMGRRRRRVYVRKFDWAEARARYAAGETLAAISKTYGVTHHAIQRVVNLPAHMIATASSEEMQRLAALGREQVPCPRCERPKSRGAALCHACFNETRVSDVRIETVPGEKRVVLADCAVGRIVRVGGRWGVVCRGGSSEKARIVDFWEGGRERIADITIVETAPTKRIYVGDVEEEPEEIVA